MFGCQRKHRGWRRDRRGRGDAAPPDPQRTEDMIAFVEQHLGITAEQREAWERLTEAVRDSAEVIQTARAAIHEAEEPALARLARFEVIADVASAALRRIRPALEVLYRTLDEAQRQAFDELMAYGPPHALGARF